MKAFIGLFAAIGVSSPAFAATTCTVYGIEADGKEQVLSIHSNTSPEECVKEYAYVVKVEKNSPSDYRYQSVRIRIDTDI